MRLAVLLATYKQLGDTVLLEPTLRTLSRHSGGAVGLMARPGLEPLAELMQESRVVSIRGPFRRGRLVQAERVICADPGSRCAFRALCVPSSRREVILEREEQAGGWHRWGRFTKRVVPLTGEYRALRMWRAISESSGLPHEAFCPPKLSSPSDDWAGSARDLVDAGKAPLVVHVSSAWRRKCWSPDAWDKWLRASGLASHYPIIISAGPGEWEQSVAGKTLGLTRDLGTRAAPVMELRGFLWLLSRAAGVVTVDGAASHLASAFGVATLTLFGPTDPSDWHWPSPRSLAARGAGDSVEALDTEKVADMACGLFLPPVVSA